jgi:hypothetical protein
MIYGFANNKYCSIKMPTFLKRKKNTLLGKTILERNDLCEEKLPA